MDRCNATKKRRRRRGRIITGQKNELGTGRENFGTLCPAIPLTPFARINRTNRGLRGVGTGPLKTATYFNCIVGRGEEFLAGMEMEGNGAERLVRCILRYLGRGEGRSHCFYYCLWKGEEGTAPPLFAFTRFYSREERRRSRTEQHSSSDSEKK